MSMKFRNVLAVALAATVLVVSSGASAGVTDKLADKLRDQKSEQPKKDSGQKSGGFSGPQRPDAAPAARGNDKPRNSFSGMGPPVRDNGGNSRGNSSRGNPQNAQPGNAQGAPRGDSRGENRRNDRPSGPTPNYNGPSRDDSLRDNLGRLQGRAPTVDRGNRYTNPRPPRVVTRLPGGYRDYYWNGNRYYFQGGHWYRPYGSSFITVGVPFGLFVGTLPGIYSSFWYGGTRYFYADNVYYEYEPVRRGYVVVRSPYGDDDDEYSEDFQGDDLYIYPARGQSEQQQADDRYACHRWAAQESHYDPLDDEFDAQLRKEYNRAMTACLTGRGYTVN